MASNTHAVVCLEKENAVAVIPCRWIMDPDEDGKVRCQYPPKGYSNIQKAIKNCHMPDPEWSNHEIRIFRKYDTYANARANVPKFTVTSDVSDVDTPKRKLTTAPSRTPLPKHPAELFTNVEQQEVKDSLPFGFIPTLISNSSLPQQENSGETNQSSSYGCPPPSGPPPLRQFSGNQSVQSHVFGRVHHPNPLGFSTEFNPYFDSASPFLTSSSNYIPPQPKFLNQPPIQAHGSGSSLLLENPSQTPPPENISTTAIVVDDTEFKAEVLKQLAEIRVTLSQQQSILTSILENQGSPAVNMNDNHSFPFELPTKQTSGLETLEESIANDKATREKLKAKLCTAGGNSIEECVGLMLSVLMTDEVTASFNLKGKGKTGKPGILKFSGILQLMLDGLLVNPRTKGSATMKSMHDAIAKSLKRADDRVRRRSDNKSLDGQLNAPGNPS